MLSKPLNYQQMFPACAGTMFKLIVQFLMMDLKVHSTVQKSWITPHFLFFARKMGHKRSNLLKCAKMHGNTVFKAKVKWNSNKLESQYLARLPLLFNKTLLGKISGIVSWRIFKVHLWINCALITLKFGLWEPNRWLFYCAFFFPTLLLHWDCLLGNCRDEK